MVTVSGHQVPLKTKYHAVIDATNGNTTLDPVNATFLETSLVAKGGVYELQNRDGREVRLDVTMEDGKLADVMRLAVKSAKPPMTGTLHLSTKLTLPPEKSTSSTSSCSMAASNQGRAIHRPRRPGQDQRDERPGQREAQGW